MKFSAHQRIYLLPVFLIPLLGLGIRGNAEHFPAFFNSYAPDTLWAFLIFSLAALLAPRQPTAKIAFAALGICFLMELSQLYQAAWINELRATRIGGLLLGFGFLWSDLTCYSAGITLGVTFDAFCRSAINKATN